ncbi:pyruvoyl-dependent arginine decarboxylase [Halomarina pelagica]|uniref:pyruvoyl-dependent arginine decarboxylase n=1 Tax=Halomarina pelagica TaxID=2961599 RepID=UPI0020C1F0DC|nr:pyruvoyl-dependent arginine decarboxylase [Halomarina sp. BND7]
MGLIRVVRGTANAPTRMASYDAALAEAGIHNYNLVAVSSVIPTGAHVERVGTAPDLGPAGERLTVVEARATVESGTAVAGLAWATEADGRGIFYEAGGIDELEVRARLEEGLAAGKALRDWTFVDEGRELVAVDAASDGYATAVALAVYGESAPLL